MRVESRWHSIVQLFRHWSFQLGTWWSFTHTVRWQASVQASCEDTPHTVTHVLEVGSFARLPSVRSSLQGAAAARGGGAARAGGGGEALSAPWGIAVPRGPVKGGGKREQEGQG